MNKECKNILSNSRFIPGLHTERIYSTFAAIFSQLEQELDFHGLRSKSGNCKILAFMKIERS